MKAKTTEKGNYKGKAILKARREDGLGQEEGWVPMEERRDQRSVSWPGWCLFYDSVADAHFCARVQALYLTGKVAAAPSQYKHIPQK